MILPERVLGSEGALRETAAVPPMSALACIGITGAALKGKDAAASLANYPIEELSNGNSCQHKVALKLAYKKTCSHQWMTSGTAKGPIVLRTLSSSTLRIELSWWPVSDMVT